MDSTINLNSFKFRITVIVSVLILSLKLYSSSNYILIFTNTLFESTIFLLLLLLFDYPHHKREKKRLFIFSHAFYPLFYLHAFICFANSYFLDDALYRKFSLFQIDIGTIKYFLTQIFPFTLILIIALFIVLKLLIAKHFFKTEYHIKKEVFWYFFFCSLFILVFTTFFMEKDLASPYVNTITDSKYLFQKQIEIESNVLTPDEIMKLNKNIKNYDLKITDYDRVLVFVMESVMYHEFVDDTATMSEKDNFFSKTKSISHTYTNYYTLNQDSDPSLFAMFTSIFIPFEAYVHSNPESLYYDSIMSNNNLIEYFNYNNFSTHYIISAMESPATGIKFGWYRTHNLRVFDSTNKDYLCLHVFEFQRGCEDKIMLEETKKIIKNNPKLFLLQEFVYGHGEKYIIEKGVSPTKYYSEYLDNIYDYLIAESLLDRTLIVVVSDHGNKGVDFMRSRHGYHIPLILISTIFASSINNDFSSHLDFKDILLSEMTSGASPLLFNDYSFFVGGANSGLIGYISKNEEFVVVNREAMKIIREENSVESTKKRQFGIFNEYEKNFNVLINNTKKI